MLLGKSAGIVALGLLGAYAKTRLLPAVVARRPVWLAGGLAGELAVMGSMVGLASVLAGTTPPT